jgi:peroxiredoxin
MLMAATLLFGSGWIAVSREPVSSTTAGRIPSPREGFSAPGFTLERLDGKVVTLADMQGQVVVINLWASWCPPCREEMPTLERVYRELKGEGVELLAVNTSYQDSLAEATAFVKRYGLTFPILVDARGEVARRYQLRALPSTFFVNADGVIRKVIIGGPMSEATIRTSIEELLAERR